MLLYQFSTLLIKCFHRGLIFETTEQTPDGFACCVVRREATETNSIKLKSKEFFDKVQTFFIYDGELVLLHVVVKHVLFLFTCAY